MRALIWLVPFSIFLFYFVYCYQTLIFWALFFAVGAWLLVLQIGRMFQEMVYFHSLKKTGRILDIFFFGWYYISPFISLCWAIVKFQNSGGAILLGIVWYAGILVKYLSDRIHKYNINIDLIEGSFRGIRKGFYRMATKVPWIGYRKEPFKALNAVSLDIQTGMFGLLGPNGAGKTTLMRIICGIFEQSYGKSLE